MLEGGQVDLGGHLAVLRLCTRLRIQRASSGGLSAFRPEGRELCCHLRRVRRAPAVPPSLALRRFLHVGEPPHWGRDAGSTGRCHSCLSAAAFFRRLRGDLHVAPAPGLAPSPGRSWLRTPLLVPIHASRSAQCTAPGGQRPTGFPGPAGRGVAGRRESVRTDPNAEAAVFASWDGRLGGLPGGELGTTLAGSPRGTGGAGESGGVPRCRGTQVDLSSQHDSRARSQYVKGPRPWWRRRPPYSSRRPADPWGRSVPRRARHSRARPRRRSAARRRPVGKRPPRRLPPRSRPLRKSLSKSRRARSRPPRSPPPRKHGWRAASRRGQSRRRPLRRGRSPKRPLRRGPVPRRPPPRRLPPRRLLRRRPPRRPPEECRRQGGG